MKLVIKPVFEVFYDTNSNFGIFACEISEENEDSKKVVLNQYGNVTVKGVMPLLEKEKLYTAQLKEVRDKKYGVGYEVISIYENQPTTRKEQVDFLKAILTENQVKSIVEAYPKENLLELIEEEKMDLSLVHGIGDKTFKRIRDKLIQNKHLQKVLVELQSEYGLSHKMIAKLMEAYKSPALLLDKVRANPYILADEVQGIGFKKADFIALKKGIKPNSYNRLYACLKYILNEQANNGHTYLNRRRIILYMCETLNLPKERIETFLKLMEKDKDVIVNHEMYALKYLYLLEKSIATDIKRLQDTSYYTDVPKLEERISEIEIEQGFDFTGEQREAIFQAMETNVLLINGRAGTGKTSVIKGIVNILRRSKVDFTYHTIALSGKASQRIKESTGLESSTIHRFLGVDNNHSFIHNRENPVHSDLVIIDEASMVNVNLFAKVLEALENGCKVVITGDYSQLEPIGAGNVFYDLCLSESVNRIELTQVHRQAKRSGILSEANKIREGIISPSLKNTSTTHIGELKDLHYYPQTDSEHVLNKIIHISRKYKESNMDILKFQIITPMKNRGKLCTFELNQQLQDIFNPLISNQKILKKGKVSFREKDKVIHNGNNYNIGVLNGTLGLIEKIDLEEEVVFIHFEHVGLKELAFNNLKDIDLAYALTIHKSQGSQFENCIVALDCSSYTMLSQQLLYTAITRAIHHCYLVCERKALFHAIQTDKSSNRNTFLKQFIRELS